MRELSAWEREQLRIEFRVIEVGGGHGRNTGLNIKTLFDPLKLQYGPYCFLEFNEDETKPRWPISAEGLIEKKAIPLLVSTDHLPLTKDLFKKDAIVLKFPTSSIVSLGSEKTTHGLDFNFSGFPYLGLWAAHNADFLCIEPWCGIADPVDADQQLVNKEGINRLPPGNVFERKWTASFF
jgi:galactose mutarotase-like enzyme